MGFTQARSLASVLSQFNLQLCAAKTGKGLRPARCRLKPPQYFKLHRASHRSSTHCCVVHAITRGYGFPS